MTSEALALKDSIHQADLSAYMGEFRDHIVRVLTVLPRRESVQPS
jgi:hypothetical protein